MSTPLPAAIQPIIHFVKSQCGIDLHLSMMQPLLAIESRMQAQACTSYDDYLLRLQCHAEELQALIEAVVVPETWFFRYPESFDYLIDSLPHMQTERLDILSVPCSTGEEPYSIAMRLLMHGMPHQNFHIDAADISAIALNRAEAALYYEHSFRHHELSFRDRYFDGLFDSHIQRPYWKLHPHVCQTVHFYAANILQANSNFKSQYDVIFCRNLLIYFDKDTQVKVLQRLYSMLKDGGLLFLGHAGSGQGYLRQHFTLLNHRAFVWQKGGQKKQSFATRVRPVAIKQVLPRSVKQENVNVEKAINSPELKLNRIEVLANQGKLCEAKKSCEQYTEQYPSQAEGWYLLGVIMQADNCLNQAKQHFQKTLYLEPNHENSLLQLAGIAEHEGKNEQASRFRQRLQQGQV